MPIVTTGLKFLWRWLQVALLSVFGVVQWQAPGWLRTLSAGLTRGGLRVASKPWHSLALLLLTISGAAGSWYAYQAWQLRPQPVTVDFEVSAPTRTELERKAKPKPLTLTFNASVAPLALVGQDVSAGISLSPKLEGRWHWLDDRRLEFRPAQDWPIQQSIRVQFAKTVVAEQIQLARWDFEFNSPAFTGTVEQAEFYQDPLDSALKKAIFQLKFSHPLDTEHFAEHLKLQLETQTPNRAEQQSESLPFTISYDKLKLKAFIHSKALAIPRQRQQIVLTLAEDVKADAAEATLAAPLTAQVEVPGLYNTLSINDLQLTVTANANTQQQEQLLIINSSVPVHEQEMAKAIKVWLLPEQQPRSDGNEPEARHAWSVDEVTPDVLKQSLPLTLQPLPAEREFTELHSFRINAEVGRHLLVKITKNLPAFGGYLLPETFYRTLVVPEFPKELHIMGEGSLLTLSGDKKIALMTRDLPGVHVELGRILPDQLQHLVSQSEGDFSHPNFFGDFGQDNLSERFDVKIPLPGLVQGQTHYQALDLNQYLVNNAGQDKRGIFLLTTKNYDPAQPNLNEDLSYGQVVDNRLILVTDLGIIVKQEQDGSQVVFVQSIHSGQAQVDAEVEVIGKNGLVLFSGITDLEGKVRFANLSGLERERQPLLYLVRYQGDMSFLPVDREDRKLDFSRFSIDGAENALDERQLNAYLFSDRGLYRPGDTVKLGMIVKTEQWSNDLAGIPLEAEILDARGLVVKRSKLNVNAGGFNELSFETLDTSATGRYTANVYTVKDGKSDQHLGSTTFKVEEFEPDRMKAKIEFSQPLTAGWVHPQALTAIVNVQNLFGSPAEAWQVEASMTLKPALPGFKAYPDYHFYDPHYAKEGYDETLNPAQTDQAGNALFDLDLEKYAQASFQLHLVARAFEAQSGRSVAAEADTLVSDLPYLVGFKADGSLEFVAQNAERNAHLLAIDPNLKPLAADNLTLEFLERKVLSVLTRQQDNTYRYESRPKESSLHKEPLTISASGFQLRLESKTPGNYSYVIRNAEGVLLSRIDYSVAGQGNVSRTLDRNAELQITLDKAEYAPGETIAVNIRAPYTGAGLITIEREKVYKSVWFKANTQASVQTITVPQELKGNAYVTVHYIREPGSDEIFMSPLSFGVAPFKISLAAQTEALTLTVPERIKPGQSLPMTVHSPEATHVVVFAVDEGILQVARYQNPDPLGYFFQKRQLAVDTSQILDLILPEFNKLMQASAPGGDGEEDQQASFLNPFKRKHDQPAVYWSGIFELNGDKTLHYAVPETFNGSLRVLAIAVNDQKIASISQSTQVRGDLIMTPNAPFMVAPGDEFTVSVTVANNIKASGSDAKIQVSLAVPAQLSIQGASQQTLTIAEGHEAAVSFQLKTHTGKDVTLGNATLNFNAASAGVLTKMHTDLSIRPASPKLATLRFGHFKGQQEVNIERQLYPEYRIVNAGLSPLPLVAIPGLTRYLDNFEHSCTEQLISKAIPILVLGKHPEFTLATDTQNTEAEFLRLLSVLRSRQNAEGGFGLWTASPDSHEFASVYATHLLLEALQNGLPVPDDLVRNSLHYLQTLATAPSNELAGLRNRAYATYLLTRQGQITTAMLATIRESLTSNIDANSWRQDSVATFLAASYQLLKQQSAADALIKTPAAQLGQASTDYQYADYYDPLIRDAQTLYLMAKHFPQQLQTLPPSMFQGIASALESQHYNTLSSAYLLLAYNAYLDSIPLPTDQTMTLSSIDAAGVKQALALPQNWAPRVSFPDSTRKLLFEGGNNLPFYYAIAESGFDLEPARSEVHNGVEIFRSYLNAKGETVEQVELGEELTVLLRLRALNRDYIGNIAIQELLPGGFEAVLQTSQTNQELIASNQEANAESSEAPADDAPETTAADTETEAETETNTESESEPVSLPIWTDRLAVGGNWASEYTDVREDRVLLYGSVNQELAEYRYKIRATSAGLFTVPPSYVSAMYEPTIQAHTIAGKIKVLDSSAKAAPQ